MAKLILIHGHSGRGTSHWNPYTKEHFEKAGWEVFAPDMPNSDNPVLEEWLEHLEKTTSLTEDTVIVGHSLGCPFICSVLKRSDVQIKKAILVGGLYNKERKASAFLEEDYEWEKIKNNVKEIFFINSTNDPFGCDEAEADFAFSKLGGTKIIMEGQGHFGSGKHNQVYKEFPLLIKLISDQ